VRFYAVSADPVNRNLVERYQELVRCFDDQRSVKAEDARSYETPLPDVDSTNRLIPPMTATLKVPADAANLNGQWGHVV